MRLRTWFASIPSTSSHAPIGAAAYEGVAAFSRDSVGALVVGIVTVTIATAIFIQADRSDPVTAGDVLADDRHLAPLHAGGAAMGAAA